MGSKVRGKKTKAERVSLKNNVVEFLEQKHNQQIAIGLAVLIVLSGFAVAIYLADRGDDEDDDRNSYLKSIDLGGEWFLNNQDNSFLYYQYDLDAGVHSTSHHSMREMGALWSITLLQKFLGGEQYANLSDRGFDHFEEHFEYDSDDDFLFVNITPTKIKLGYSAFIILILLEMEDDLKDYYLTQFANGILFQQQGDGSFDTFFYKSLDPEEETGVDYYPGESLFALMKLYQYTGNRSYLEAVEKAFPHYRDYWRSTNSTAFIPWQTRAYALLYQETKKREYADFVFEMNDHLVDAYFPARNCSGFNFQASTVAVHMEGMIQAYRLAEDLKDKDRAACYRNFIREGADFTLSLQVTSTANIFEEEAVGGFRGDPNSFIMRVDYNQHAVTALMEGYEVGILA